jgi:hypothetical protein
VTRGAGGGEGRGGPGAGEVTPPPVSGLAILTALASAALFYPLGWWLHERTGSAPDPAELAARFIVLARDVRPEPGERNAFVVACLFLPAAIFGASALLAPRLRTGRARALVSGSGLILLAAVAGWLGWNWRRLDLQELTRFAASAGHPVGFAVFATLAMGVLVIAGPPAPAGGWTARVTAWVGVPVAVAYAALASLLRLLPDASPYVGGFHFSAVFNSVVSVMQGQVLLRDVSNTYGLYPHFLHPLFALIGLTPLTFSAAMAAITFGSQAGLLAFLARAVQGRGLRLLGMLAVVEACCLLRPLPVSAEPYWQYVPLRLLFPSLLLWQGGAYLRRPGRRRYLGTLALAAVAVLWNPDTGVVCCVAWEGTLWLTALTEGGTARSILGRCLRHALTSLGVLATVLAVYSVLILAAYGKAPDFTTASEVQQLFLRYGYLLMPMPLVHAWLLYALACLAGLALVAADVFQGRANPATHTLFLATLLATGGFSYYQGRSVTSNLIGPGYLAVVVLVLVADRLMRELHELREAQAATAGRVTATACLACALLPVSFLAFGALVKPEVVIDELRGTWRAIQAERKTPGPAEYLALRRYIRPGEPLLVLSYASGPIHLYTGTPSAVFDSFTELFKRRDHNAVAEALARRTTRVVVVERSLGSPEASVLLAVTDANYHRIDGASGGRFEVLERN